MRGGRAIRVGLEALYMAFDHDTERLDSTDHFDVYDPRNAVPRDQSSWARASTEASSSYLDL
jgi:hypothetical protein